MAMRWSVRIKPEITADRRFSKLLKQSGSDWEAIGKLYYFWSMACGYYVQGEAIPRDKFDSLGTPELLDLGFAEVVEAGVRAKGDSEHFAWAMQCVESGRKGGLAKASRRQAKVSNWLGDAKQPLSEPLPLEQEQEQEELNPIVAKATHSTSVENQALKSKINLMIDLWNEESGSLPKVARVSAQRKAKIETRLKDEPDLEVWRKVFRAIASWPFGLGDNDRGWKASFDYALQPGTLDKFEAGAYEARTKNMATAHRNSITMQSEQPVIFNDLTERLTDEWERENAGSRL